MSIAIARDAWQPRKVVIPQDTLTKTELAVHHTADKNRAYTATEERQKMRELQGFHIDTRGYADIAYSWLIFPSGRAYTGRGFNGLPAGQLGENSGTWAICFVGDFTNREPTKAARLKLQSFVERLIEFSDGHLQELGGHREFPHQSTECPGNGLMAVVQRNRERFDLRRPK